MGARGPIEAIAQSHSTASDNYLDDSQIENLNFQQTLILNRTSLVAIVTKS